MTMTITRPISSPITRTIMQVAYNEMHADEGTFETMEYDNAAMSIVENTAIASHPILEPNMLRLLDELYRFGYVELNYHHNTIGGE